MTSRRQPPVAAAISRLVVDRSSIETLDGGSAPGTKCRRNDKQEFMSLTTAVNRDDLTQQVPELISAHPLLDWHTHDFSATTKLVVDLWLRTEPQRRGQVVFDPKREMFTSKVHSHEQVHTDETSSDGVGSLRLAIDRTGQALIGPTEFSVTYAAGVVVRSSMSIDFDDVHLWSSTGHPGRRLHALLRGKLRTNTLNDYWARVEPPTGPALDKGHA